MISKKDRAIGFVLVLASMLFFAYVPLKPSVIIKPGFYEVGVDIDPGTYRMEKYPTEEEGYYGVFTSSNITKDTIVDVEIFTTAQDVTVVSGEYLQISHARGKLIGK